MCVRACVLAYGRGPKGVGERVDWLAKEQNYVKARLARVGGGGCGECDDVATSRTVISLFAQFCSL